MGIWGWVQAIATGWMTLSILLAVAWALGAKKIFRPRPAQPTLSEGELNALANQRRLDRIAAERRGGER